MADFLVQHSVLVLEDGREVHTLADADEHRCDKVHMWAKDCPSCELRDGVTAAWAATMHEDDEARVS